MVNLMIKETKKSNIFVIKGIGKSYASLLQLIGVTATQDLRLYTAANLHTILINIVITHKEIVKNPPTFKKIENWIVQAKKIEQRAINEKRFSFQEAQELTKNTGGSLSQLIIQERRENKW